MIDIPETAALVGRVWRQGIGKSVVTLRAVRAIDITSRSAPTVRDARELPDPAGYLHDAPSENMGALSDLLAASFEAAPGSTHFLAPCDLQAIKACGVTFAWSMIERVIEERAGGNPARVAEIRARVA
jgi:fumarylacetoacetate (FAA) hydrolase family protein